MALREHKGCWEGGGLPLTAPWNCLPKVKCSLSSSALGQVISTLFCSWTGASNLKGHPQNHQKEGRKQSGIPSTHWDLAPAENFHPRKHLYLIPFILLFLFFSFSFRTENCFERQLWLESHKKNPALRTVLLNIQILWPELGNKHRTQLNAPTATSHALFCHAIRMCERDFYRTQTSGLCSVGNTAIWRRAERIQDVGKGAEFRPQLLLWFKSRLLALVIAKIPWLAECGVQGLRGGWDPQCSTKILAFLPLASKTRICYAKPLFKKTKMQNKSHDILVNMRLLMQGVGFTFSWLRILSWIWSTEDPQPGLALWKSLPLNAYSWI